MKGSNTALQFMFCVLGELLTVYKGKMAFRESSATFEWPADWVCGVNEGAVCGRGKSPTPKYPPVSPPLAWALRSVVHKCVSSPCAQFLWWAGDLYTKERTTRAPDQ